MTNLVEYIHHHKCYKPMVGEAVSFPLGFLETLDHVLQALPYQ
jgi:hypothetical protein